MLKNAIAAGLLLGLAHGMIVPPAEAHNRRHRHRHQTVVVTPWFAFWQQPRQPRVRVNEHCVYKPWTNRTICRY